MIYIYTHLGLGDHILCNGLVRHFSENENRVYVFVKPTNINNVAFMYRDNPTIKLISMYDHEVQQFMSINRNNKYIVAGISTEYHRKLNNNEYETFDIGFYDMVNIPLEYKWDKFHINRNQESEKDAFYNKLSLQDGEDFILIHDDVSRGMKLNLNYIQKGIKIINIANYQNIGIFDFIYAIEQAREVHVMNSSFACLIDTMQIRNDNIFYHEYARPNTNFKLKLNWNILKF